MGYHFDILGRSDEIVTHIHQLSLSVSPDTQRLWLQLVPIASLLGPGI